MLSYLVFAFIAVRCSQVTEEFMVIITEFGKLDRTSWSFPESEDHEETFDCDKEVLQDESKDVEQKTKR